MHKKLVVGQVRALSLLAKLEGMKIANYEVAQYDGLAMYREKDFMLLASSLMDLAEFLEED